MFPSEPNLSEDLKEFILDLLQKDPQDRCPAHILLRHPFIIAIEDYE